VVVSAGTTAGTAGPTPGIREAYQWCRAYTAAHQENFTVVSWLLPERLRHHFWALYAYCRCTDDLGDEAEGDRLALLDDWERRVRACWAGRAEEPLFVALAHTAVRCQLPLDPFLRLIEANRMDQRITRFDTYDDLLHYCQHSATPVGQMVLGVLGYRGEEHIARSDDICIGLQLANFWQDVSVDWAKGRLYLPLEDLRRFDVGEDVIDRREPTPAFRRLMQFEVERATALFRRGRALEGMVRREARLDIQLFRRGGEAVLDAIRARRYDVLTGRPRIPRWKRAWIGASGAARILLHV
jgi:squalene synthase HpnC